MVKSRIRTTSKDYMDAQQRTTVLLEIMRKHKLSAADVGGLLERSAQTVRAWRCKNAGRIIPVNELKLLQATIKATT